MTQGSTEETSTNFFQAASIAELQAGSVILSRYSVVDLLGQGGMGSVYRVKDENGSCFALKFLHKQHTSEATWRRFDIEAKTANRLDHPNLIKVYESGLLADGQPFFIMDLVEGQTLEDLLKKKGRLSVNQCIKIFIQVGFALSYAHANGVIHRDIKPSNIMIQKIAGGETGDATVKVVDFGIAKLTGQDEYNQQTLTRTGEIFGSPLYMSPEQCLATGIDHRSDLYSLGCVMYEALTGAPPFVGESALSTMMKHQTEEALSLKEASLGIEFPPGLEYIVSKLLAKNNSERYQSAQLLTSDLVNFDINEHAADSQKTAKFRAANHSVRQRDFAKKTGVAIGLLCAGIVTGYFLHHKHETVFRVTVPTEFTEAPRKEGASAKSIQTEPALVNTDEKKLAALESKKGFFSTVDEAHHVRIFHFPDFSIGRLKDPDNSLEINAIGEKAVAIDQAWEFQPTMAFKRHPLLFKKFRNEELNALNIADPKAGLENSDTANILKNCSQMSEIEKIHLEDTRLTMQGWKYINKFPKLTHLWLSRISLSPVQIATYEHFPQLRLLRMRTEASISPVLQKLQGSSNMGNLSICETATTDEDAKIIGSMHNLRRIELKDTKITDAGVLSLPSSLDSLDLTGCAISSKCLPALVHLERLKTLKLDAIGWSDLELKALKKFAAERQIELETAKQHRFE